MGVVSGFAGGLSERTDALLEQPSLYHFANWLTLGAADLVKGAVDPDEPLSLEHWLSSLGVVMTAKGIYDAARPAMQSLRETAARAERNTPAVVQKQEKIAEAVLPDRPIQTHHYATNKNRTYTPQMETIARRYHLDLDGEWNKALLPHQGRHPNAYHDYVLEEIRRFDNIAQGDVGKFLRLYAGMKQEIDANPDMLYKTYWNK